MASVLLPLCLAMLIAAFRRRGRCWREAALGGAATFGVVVAAITECLSAFQRLTFGPLTAAWIVACAFATIAAVFGLPPSRQIAAAPAATRPSFQDRLFLIIIAVFVTAIMLTALFAPPNTWDSMTYHLARVEHWRQNASVADYPTSIPRQLYHPPFAEFMILHLRLLAGSDRLASLPAVAAFIGSILAASLIARELGLDRHGQILTATIVAIIPSGLLQASGTQNNPMVAFWLAAGVFYFLRWKEPLPVKRRMIDRASIGIGICFGLALLTKGTTIFFAAPFAAWMILIAMRERSGRRLLQIAIVGGLVLAINASHWSRNVRTFGSPLTAKADVPTLRNDTIGPRLLASNIVRNILPHWATASGRINAAMLSAAGGFHRLIGISLNEPAITTNGQFALDTARRHEDISGNPWHLLLAIVAFAWLTRRRDWPAVRLLVAAAIGGVVFSAVLKWQPYASRLQLPLFVLAAAPVAAMIARKRCAVQAIIIATLVYFAFPMAFMNRTRPLIGKANIFQTPREMQYFVNAPALAEPCQQVASLLAARGITAVDLVCGGDRWEYPFWPLMTGRGVRNFNIRFAYVNNPSAACPQPGDNSPRPLLLLDADQRSALRTLRPGWAEDDVGPLTLFLPPMPAR